MENQAGQFYKKVSGFTNGFNNIEPLSHKLDTRF